MNCFFVEQQIHHSLKSLSRITVLLAMLLCVSWRTKILLGKSTFRWLSRKLSKWSNNMLAPDMNILIQTCYVLLCFLEINHNLSDTFELVLAEQLLSWDFFHSPKCLWGWTFTLRLNRRWGCTFTLRLNSHCDY